MRRHIHRLYKNFLIFLELQLLISIVITPFLIGWGLALSTISILGNLIFSQFLTSFICISSAIFTTDLFGISNIFLQKTLTLITSIWCFLLSYASSYWLIAFPYTFLPGACMLAITACSIYHYQIPSQKIRLSILLSLSLMLPVMHAATRHTTKHHVVEVGNKKFYIILYKNQVYGIDMQALGAKKGYESWIEYTLIPELIKSVGLYKIDCLITCLHTQRSEKALEFLSKQLPVHKIIQIASK